VCHATEANRRHGSKTSSISNKIWYIESSVMKTDTLQLVYFAYFYHIMSYGIIFQRNSTNGKSI
jgi:hypothetical protein